MILYHGTPINPKAHIEALAGEHFCVAFYDPRQLRACHEIGAGVMLDNSAYGIRRSGIAIEWREVYAWMDQWLSATTWGVIPDVVDGGAEANDALISQWPHGLHGAPVWHMDEPIERLLRLVEAWPRVCIGSSGRYSVVMSPEWQHVMDCAWNAIVQTFGEIPNVHMLRGLQLCSTWSGRRWPISSADSTDIARNHNRPQNTPAGMAARWSIRALHQSRTWSVRPPYPLQLEIAL